MSKNWTKKELLAKWHRESKQAQKMGYPPVPVPDKIADMVPVISPYSRIMEPVALEISDVVHMAKFLLPTTRAEDGMNQEEVAALVPNEDPFAGLTERQKNIARQRLRGIPVAHIQRQAGITAPTVYKELAAIKEFYAKKGSGLTQDIVIGETVSVYQEVEHKAWEVFVHAKDGNEKSKALQLVLQAREKQNKLYMDVGLLDKAATKHVHLQADVSPFIKKWNNDTRIQATTQILESQFTVLESPVSLDDADELGYTPYRSIESNEVEEESSIDEDEDEESTLDFT